MATSGRPAAAPRKSGSAESARSGKARTTRSAFAAAACLAVLVLNGCAAPVVKIGRPPAIDRLAELRAGESTTRDVVAVLGEPQGRGAARSGSFGLKDAWLYESAEVEGTKAKMRMLMVFLDKETGVYQGHMWMASGMVFGLTRE
jgi:hypothetical protein